MVGHSDADVLLHAITDAILGAAALSDIGELFPNDDLANRNRDSAEMLAIAKEHVLGQGYKIVNLDCIIFAERPKLRAYKPEISRRIAEILQISPADVGVKDRRIRSGGLELRSVRNSGRSSGVEVSPHFIASNVVLHVSQ